MILRSEKVFDGIQSGIIAFQIADAFFEFGVLSEDPQPLAFYGNSEHVFGIVPEQVRDDIFPSFDRLRHQVSGRAAILSFACVGALEGRG
jgi:hypothetical protein